METNHCQRQLNALNENWNSKSKYKKPQTLFNEVIPPAKWHILYTNQEKSLQKKKTQKPSNLQAINFTYFRFNIQPWSQNIFCMGSQSKPATVWPILKTLCHIKIHVAISGLHLKWFIGCEFFYQASSSLCWRAWRIHQPDKINPTAEPDDNANKSSLGI